MAAQVQIYGRDSTLLGIRALVLARVGVQAACSVVASSDLTEMRHTRLAVLCSSLPVKEQELVAARIKTRWADTDVLMIQSTAGQLTQYASGIHICGADPEEIVSSCKTLLSKSSTESTP